MNKVLDALFRRTVVVPAIPICADHKQEMRLRGKLGRPTRFSDQTEEDYTLIYFCPVEGCDHSAEVTKSKSQIPVPGEAPARPSFSRASDTLPR